jgi:hypothetical protein
VYWLSKRRFGDLVDLMRDQARIVSEVRWRIYVSCDRFTDGADHWNMRASTRSIFKSGDDAGRSWLDQRPKDTVWS